MEVEVELEVEEAKEADTLLSLDAIRLAVVAALLKPDHDPFPSFSDWTVARRHTWHIGGEDVAGGMRQAGCG